MSTFPLISVIVPVYNVEKYLLACLNSILCQTYPNLEVIVVIDGATDGSLAVAKSINDSRLRIIEQENQGLSGARNTGLAHIKGSYFCFIDSDDLIAPNYLECLYTALSQAGAPLAICNLRSFNDAENPEHLLEKSPASPLLYSQKTAIDALYNKNTLVPFTVACSKLYETSTYRELTFPVGKIHEDVAVALDVLLQAPALVYLPQELYYYRYNPRSITNTPSAKHLEAVDFYLAHYQCLLPLSAAQANQALVAAAKTALNHLAHTTPSWKRADREAKALAKRLKSLITPIKFSPLPKQDKILLKLASFAPLSTARLYALALKLRK